MSAVPQLSVILMMYRDFNEIRASLRRLQAQTVVDQVELLLVTTHDLVDSVDQTMLTPFGSYQMVAIDSLEYVGQAFAAGFAAARAPYVAMAEDHCLVEAEWAEAFIKAHQSGHYAVVAPRMEIGNPETAISRANFLICFLEWYAPDGADVIHAGPGHNSCYNKQIIMEHFSDLDAVFTMEYAYQREIASRGEKIMIEPHARILHWTNSTLPAYTSHAYHGGRVYGASRVIAEKWGWGKRIAFSVASPLIPLVRIKRIVEHLNTPEKKQSVQLARTMPAILWGLLCHTTGEVIGYLAGEGTSVHESAKFELRRRDFVLPSERTLLQE